LITIIEVLIHIVEMWFCCSY